MLKDEQTLYSGGSDGRWQRHGGGGLESQLRRWKDKPVPWNSDHSVEAYIYKAISSWLVYHFHDTSMTAPMRRNHLVRDKQELNPDASNIAPFLLRLQKQNRNTYEKIMETIRLIAPFFDEFMLRPEENGGNELVRLEWRQKGSSFPFQPWQLSDGTIRFICLVTALLQPDPPATVVIDEPELGLHPFALDVLAGLFREVSQRTQLIVSTQSAILLNHFEPDAVVVLDRKNGGTRFRRLDKVALRTWLEDYTLGDLWQKNVFDGGPAHE